MGSGFTSVCGGVVWFGFDFISVSFLIPCYTSRGEPEKWGRGKRLHLRRVTRVCHEQFFSVRWLLHTSIGPTTALACCSFTCVHL